MVQDQDGVLAWVSERLAVCMRQSEDLLLRDYVVAAASAIMAGGSNGDNPGYTTAADFSLVTATLDTNNAYKFVAGIPGADKYGTGPVRSAYLCLTSTELQPDFDALQGSGFQSVNAYPNDTNALQSEYGALLNVRILTSSQAPVARGASANGRDVYYSTFFGSLNRS